ncbi:MAG: serine hydrolase family protein [Proteobacteria bacterium]|nr:serine hydrolase family protein [Pseudomonadota bacterium]
MRINGRIVRHLLRDVRQALGERLDWSFIDAPNPATGPPLGQVGRLWPREPYFEWWNALEQPDGSVSYRGVEATLVHMRRVLAEQGPFDVLVGYSQGAALAAVLTALAEGAHRSGSGVPSPTWRLVLLFNSGPPPRDRKLERLFEGAPLRTRSVHVHGGPGDPGYEEQKRMVDLWSADTRQVYEHGQGHVPPSLRASPGIMAALSAAVVRAL